MKNAENQKKRNNVSAIQAQMVTVNNLVDEAQKKLEELQAKQAQLAEDYDIATTAAKDLEDESTAELEEQIKNVDAINQKVRANQERARALQEAADYKADYDNLTGELETIREDKNKLLESVQMPLSCLLYTSDAADE